MSRTASPVRATADSAAATNDRTAGNFRSSDVWAQKYSPRLSELGHDTQHPISQPCRGRSIGRQMSDSGGLPLQDGPRGTQSPIGVTASAEPTPPPSHDRRQLVVSESNMTSRH